MSINFSAGDEEPVDVLATTETALVQAAENLARLINRIKDGNFQDARATPEAVKGLHRALEVVVLGRRDVEKLCKQVTGTVGATSRLCCANPLEAGLSLSLDRPILRAA